MAPLRVQIRPGKYREPDILLVRDSNDMRRQNAFWLGADLVVEIVSRDRPERDIVEKPLDYAEAGIPEYWIVNPLDETVSVLDLEDDVYSKQTVFRRGETARPCQLDEGGHIVEVVQAMSINNDLISTSFMQPSAPLLSHSRPGIVDPVGIMPRSAERSSTSRKLRLNLKSSQTACEMISC